MSVDASIRTPGALCAEMSPRMDAREPQAILFRNARGHTFKLTPAVVGQLWSHAQIDKRLREAGGVLLGRYLLHTDDVVVDQITVPLKSDLRTRSGFVRGTMGHQEVVNRVWEASNGACHYLGEWHTHPEAKPSPSSIDTANWRRLLLHYRADPDPLYFVIVGTQGIAAWQGYKKPIRLERLTAVAGKEEPPHETNPDY